MPDLDERALTEAAKQQRWTITTCWCGKLYHPKPARTYVCPGCDTTPVAVEVVPESSRSTPPLDEWLKGDEALKAIRAQIGAVSLSEGWLASRIRDALLEALAEHRKEGQHG